MQRRQLHCSCGASILLLRNDPVAVVAGDPSQRAHRLFLSWCSRVDEACRNRRKIGSDPDYSGVSERRALAAPAPENVPGALVSDDADEARDLRVRRQVAHLALVHFQGDVFLDPEIAREVTKRYEIRGPFQLLPVQHRLQLARSLARTLDPGQPGAPPARGDSTAGSPCAPGERGP